MHIILDFLKRYWKTLLVLWVVVLVFRACGKKESDRPFTWHAFREVTVRRGSIFLDISATGEVKPQNRLEVKPSIAGRVDEIYVKEGDMVKQGDLLAQLSSTERAALLDSARMKSDDDLKYWEEAYRPTPLIAPISGTVIVRSVEPGQTVASGESILVISDRLIVDALVNETDIAKVRIGQQANIVLDAYSDRSFKAKVDHIAFESELDKNVNIYHVDIVPDQNDPVFRSGMTAQVHIRSDARENVLLITQDALTPCPQEMDRGPGAWCAARKIRRGEPVWEEIEVGLTNGLEAEVVSGLKEGDTVWLMRKKTPKESKRGSPFSPFGSKKRKKS